MTSIISTYYPNYLKAIAVSNAMNVALGDDQLAVIKPTNSLLGVETGTRFLFQFDIIRKRRRTFAEEYAELDKEIMEYYLSERITDSELNRRLSISEKLAARIQRSTPDSELIVMGSTASLCGYKSSDLDLCLGIKGERGYDLMRRFEIQALDKIKVSLDTATLCGYPIKSVRVIDARVPIIKCIVEDDNGELDVDINCNNVAGVYNSYLLHHYARLDKRFPALCLVVKQWAKAACINDPMNGSLNSYTLKLMVLHYLQCAVWPPVLPNLSTLDPSRFGGLKYDIPLDQVHLFDAAPQLPPEIEVNTQPLSDLLMGFFVYYANFSFSKHEIWMRHAHVKKRTSVGEDSYAKMVIKGPFDSVNTARTVKTDESLQLIKDVFRRASHVFLNPIAKAPIFQEIIDASY